jgi:hypothetical protein
MVHLPVQMAITLKDFTGQLVNQAGTCRSGPSLSKRGARVKLAIHANTSPKATMTQEVMAMFALLAVDQGIETHDPCAEPLHDITAGPQGGPGRG